MALTHTEITGMVDKDYVSGQTNRQESADDRVFFWITHWSGDLFEGSNLPFKGEFDVIRKAYRRIAADLKENQVQAKFESLGDVPEETKDYISGKYLASHQDNSSIEALDNADSDMVVCGVGAWEIYTEYENIVADDRKQIIKRRPIPEANNVMFWDSDSILKDKSDANRVALLKPYSHEGYKKLVNELTGEDMDEVTPSQFLAPENSYTFPWVSGEGEKIYVGKFFHREKVTAKYITFEDPFGETRVLEESQIESIMDELSSNGFDIVSERTEETYKVTLYIVSGLDILKTYDIPGPNIPIIPQFGERTIIEGEEHYEGITRLAKGPQILRDFILSYLTDIASRSPRPKDIYYQEQIAGYEDMYEVQGADDNLPYALMNLVDINGQPMPTGPIGKVGGHEPPASIASLIDLTKQAIKDVADSGVEDMANVDLAEDSIRMLTARLDMQSVVYQENKKHAYRRDAEVYAGMAAVVIDTPREDRILLPDGTKKKVSVMEQVVDSETGEIVTINDVRNTMWEVTTTIGPSYKSQKEATIKRLEKMLEKSDPQDPMRRIIQLKIIMLADGVEYEDMRDYARKELILMGITEPETDEEKQLVEQRAQQGQQPDANMVLAQAEMMKGRADIMREQRETQKLQLEYQAKGLEINIDAYDSITKRMGVQVQAEKAKADIDSKQIENYSKTLDSVMNLRGRATPTQPAEA